jgi:hypothetical protein
MQWLRFVAAAAVGVTLAVLLAYFAAVAVVLATIGIPLGAQSRDLTPTGYAVLLLAACAASFAGSRTANRLAGVRQRESMIVVTLVLAVGSAWLFSGSRGWPSWWALTLGGAMALGGVIGLQTVRSPRGHAP